MNQMIERSSTKAMQLNGFLAAKVDRTKNENQFEGVFDLFTLTKYIT